MEEKLEGKLIVLITDLENLESKIAEKQAEINKLKESKCLPSDLRRASIKILQLKKDVYKQQHINDDLKSSVLTLKLATITFAALFILCIIILSIPAIK